VGHGRAAIPQNRSRDRPGDAPVDAAGRTMTAPRARDTPTPRGAAMNPKTRFNVLYVLLAVSSVFLLNDGGSATRTSPPSRTASSSSSWRRAR
jgi:hypothetical protein